MLDLTPISQNEARILHPHGAKSRCCRRGLAIWAYVRIVCDECRKQLAFSDYVPYKR